MAELTDFEAGALVQEVKHLNQNLENLENTLKNLNERWNKEHDNLADRVKTIELKQSRYVGIVVGATTAGSILGGFISKMM